MKNTLIKWLFSDQMHSKNKTRYSEAGFTILEVVTVAVIVGILSAIAAPAWDAFRSLVNVFDLVNNQILSTLQSAQTQATRNKESMSIVFNTDDSRSAGYFDAGDSILEYKIYPTDPSNDDDPNVVKDIPSETLNIDGQINEDKIELFVLTQNDTSDFIINFNDQGAMPDDQSFPVYITIRSQDKEDGQKCAVIQTLLGSMRTDEGKYNAPKGCQTE
jgi:prepilin-type N-terminal cleavage/methylation domain-containing protein